MRKKTIIKKPGLKVYENAEYPMFVNGNVYMNGAYSFKNEENHLQLEYNPKIQIDEKSDGIYLAVNLDKSILKMKNQLITTAFLGKARVPDQKYENPDGSAITIVYDYFENQRNKQNPTAGPFEKLSSGKTKFKVWEF